MWMGEMLSERASEMRTLFARFWPFLAQLAVKMFSAEIR